tara:strand:- start:296 stop:403 length:108 start_codon:yes stop_codon:yes gene_type:complete
MIELFGGIGPVLALIAVGIAFYAWAWSLGEWNNKR